MAKKKKYVDLDEMNAILRIPKETVSLTLKVQLIGEDGKLMKVERKLTVSDIHAARSAFLENVPDGDEYDAKYVLTDEGRAYLEQVATGMAGESM